MKRLINRVRSNPTQAQDPRPAHKQAAIDVAVAKLKNLNTFKELGELVGYGPDSVRKRLRNRSQLTHRNGRYLVPRGIAEEFVREMLR